DAGAVRRGNVARFAPQLARVRLVHAQRESRITDAAGTLRIDSAGRHANAAAAVERDAANVGAPVALLWIERVPPARERWFADRAAEKALLRVRFGILNTDTARTVGVRIAGARAVPAGHARVQNGIVSARKTAGEISAAVFIRRACLSERTAVGGTG